jgi:hypothetical protein
MGLISKGSLMRTFDVSYAVMIGSALLLGFVLMLSVVDDVIIKARKLKNFINASASDDKKGWLANKFGILVTLKHYQARAPRPGLKLIAGSMKTQSCNLAGKESAVFPSRAVLLILNRRGIKKDYSSRIAIGNLLSTDRYAMMRRKDDEAFERRMQAR